MPEAFICDAIRTPIGRYGGSLAEIRTDDLAALPIAALRDRNPGIDWAALDDVVLGCANQAGEDNRNVARMAALLAGLPVDVPGITLNRLCSSGLDAIGSAARAIRSGDADLLIAGGVENMSRAPYVMGKATAGFDRGQKIEDTTMGWRFVNPALEHAHGVDTMPTTAETVAREWSVSREDQDRFALISQDRAARAQHEGRFVCEIVPVTLAAGNPRQAIFDRDEHPRATTFDALARLRPIVTADGTVTAGNASGVNDGAAAMLVASEAAVARHGLIPRARIMGMASAGVAPRTMGIGPVPAVKRLLDRTGMSLSSIDVIEVNEAFAAQAVAVLRELGVDSADPRVNPNGGAIALGHPLGMSGARLVLTATEQLKRTGARYALVTMCVGVGQGSALLLESSDRRSD